MEKQLDIFGNPPVKDYFNTTNESGEDLKKYEKKAKTQSERVLALFNRTTVATPAQIHTKYCAKYGNTRITSIRRAMTVLTNKGLLQKTMEKRNGLYGRPNMCWKKT